MKLYFVLSSVIVSTSARCPSGIKELWWEHSDSCQGQPTREEFYNENVISDFDGYCEPLSESHVGITQCTYDGIEENQYYNPRGEHFPFCPAYSTDVKECPSWVADNQQKWNNPDF